MKIDRAKIEALAKRGHASCHGRGITGYTARGVLVCSCVKREMRRQGWNGTEQDAERFVGAKTEPIEGKSQEAAG